MVFFAEWIGGGWVGRLLLFPQQMILDTRYSGFGFFLSRTLKRVIVSLPLYINPCAVEVALRNDHRKLEIDDCSGLLRAISDGSAPSLIIAISVIADSSLCAKFCMS